MIYMLLYEAPNSHALFAENQLNLETAIHHTQRLLDPLVCDKGFFLFGPNSPYYKVERPIDNSYENIHVRFRRPNGADIVEFTLSYDGWAAGSGFLTQYPFSPFYPGGSRITTMITKTFRLTLC
jgi:hypothetical protein